VGIDSEETLEDVLYDLLEILRERNTYNTFNQIGRMRKILVSGRSTRMCKPNMKDKMHTDFRREDGLIIELTLHPIHQIIHIIRG
jgi:hypothetical protein